MKKLWGNIVFGFTRGLDWTLEKLTSLTAAIVSVGTELRKIIMPIFTILIFTMFMAPYLLLFLFSPLGLTLLLIAIIIVAIPFLGTKAVSALKYFRYISTETLYDYADHYRLNKERKGSFSDYSNRYKREEDERRRAQEEAYRRAQEARQKAQEEYWRKTFEDFFENGGYAPGGGSSGGGYTRGPGGSTYNPYPDFINKYQKACDTLGLSYDTDIYEVKLAYRKLAKKYHPDINKDPSAVDKFKEVSNAYEFLSEENIQRYKSINN